MRSDLRHFRSTTMGHPVIMGRKTYESLPKPLDGRLNIVVTRDPTYAAAPGVVVVHSLNDALGQAGADPEPFVIGGGELYRLALPRVFRVYRTVVDLEVEGDVWFPELGSGWRVIRDEAHERGDGDDAAYRVQVLERA